MNTRLINAVLVAALLSQTVGCSLFLSQPVTFRLRDAETKQPIPEFNVTKGHTYSPGEPMRWERYNLTRGRQGEYSVRLDEYGNGETRVLIEAPGYIPIASPPYAKSGWYTNDVALKKGRGLHGIVQLADGKPVPNGSGGYLLLSEPWPAMLRGIWGDPQRYRDTYWSRFAGNYFAGDGAKRDDDGYFWLLGRVDDVMNVAGHRISTIEVESALVDHRSVAEAAVVGKNDPVSGQAIFAFVTLRVGRRPSLSRPSVVSDAYAGFLARITLRPAAVGINLAPAKPVSPRYSSISAVE
jgi:acyl-coenzyme A synthetase/AMP-(fatty) acid ligase